MKATLLEITAVIIVLLGLQSCNKSEAPKTLDDFCTKTRVENRVVIDKEATLIFFGEQQRFALKITPPENNIDENINCFLCEKPTGIEINDKVKFTGTLFDFNESENYIPQLGGQEFYFLQRQSITKLN